MVRWLLSHTGKTVKTRKPPRLCPGLTVYARWHGEEEYIIIREAPEVKSPIRHFICQAYSSCTAREEFWVFPELQLSTKPIAPLTGEANRKQLALPV